MDVSMQSFFVKAPAFRLPATVLGRGNTCVLFKGTGEIVQTGISKVSGNIGELAVVTF